MELDEAKGQLVVETFANWISFELFLGFRHLEVNFHSVAMR